jgi:hypothetical protein
MRIAIACGLVFGAVALLPQQAAAQSAEKKVLTLEIARKIVATAETEAVRNHLAGKHRIHESAVSLRRRPITE